MSQKGPLFKVRLQSGRVLGPLDLERMAALIRKRIITGAESARKYPDTEWKKITRFNEVNELLRLNAEGWKRPETPNENAGPPPTILLDPSYTETKIDTEGSKKEKAGSSALVEAQGATEILANEENQVENPKVTTRVSPQYTGVTQKSVGYEQTVLLSRDEILKAKKGFKRKAIFSSTAVAAALTFLIIELGFDDEDEEDIKKYAPISVKANIPSPARNISSESVNKNITEGLKWYSQDTLIGYRKALAAFSTVYIGTQDQGVVPALLADCYLKLIELSLKDESYLSTIVKLIELSKSNNPNAMSTVLAETEYLLVLNRTDSALERILEYSKLTAADTRATIDIDLFYQMAKVYYTKSDYISAARYLGQIPDEYVKNPRVFNLRGLVAEALGDEIAALQEYSKAVQLISSHASSRLRRVEIYFKRGEFSKSKEDLEYLVDRPELLTSRELARVFYFSGRLSQLSKDQKTAAKFLTLAAALHPNNPEYLFELYTSRARAGKSLLTLRSQARMYYFLSEGEKLVLQGRYQDALVEFLKARQEEINSPIPLIKIGSMFEQLQDYSNARENYKMALEKKRSDPEVAAKYIRALVMGYEYDEAQKIMNEMRGVQKGRSSIDKAAADFYLRVGRYTEAALYYRKAMSRDTIDPDTYVGFGDLLIATQNPKEAPFYYTLALRYDPYNLRALLGTARAIAESESIDRAIRLLQGDLKRRSNHRAEIITAIAELEFQKGNTDAGLRLIKEAIEANPEYGKPWKLEAEYYLKKATTSEPKYEQRMKDKALLSFQSYLDRNPSDASSRIEKYKIHVSRGDFSKANDELLQVYAIYPKFPNLHFFKGALHSAQRQYELAIQEYELELESNPTNLSALVAVGREYLLVNNGAKALPYLTRGMQVEPRSAEAKHLAGYANYLLKNLEGAIALYRAALTIDPQNALIYKRMGLAYRELGDSTNAAIAFKKSLEIDPNSPDKAELIQLMR